jgi:hypothetical protein
MMIVPLSIVALSFTLACFASLLDMFYAHYVPIKAFRFFEGLILGMAAGYYWQAYNYNITPSAELRVVWVALCIVVIAEIISRQSWGTKTK